ncbi:SAM-dependent methyltransferase, partial [Priestia megaterium]
PITKTVTYETYEDLIKKNSTKVLSKDVDKLETEKIILQHVKKINDTYEYTYQYHMAFIYWKPIKRTR